MVARPPYSVSLMSMATALPAARSCCIFFKKKMRSSQSVIFLSRLFHLTHQDTAAASVPDVNSADIVEHKHVAAVQALGSDRDLQRI